MDETQPDWEMPDDLERCPTCGKFVSKFEGFCDVTPGGRRGSDYCAGYCNELCAARMDPPALCEDHGEPKCSACDPYWDLTGAELLTLEGAETA